MSGGQNGELKVGAKVRIESRDHPTMPAADYMARLDGRTGTVVPSYGKGYDDDRPRQVDLDDDRGTVLVNTLYLRELAPAPVVPDPAAEVRRAVADEVEDALGDRQRLPPEVAARMADLIGRLRTGREL